MFEKAVESSASFIWLPLNCSFASPSRPTPDSCIDWVRIRVRVRVRFRVRFRSG